MCEEGQLRLIGGSSELEGRVEVCVNEIWSTVCDNGWDDVDASVTCGQLGYSVNSEWGEGRGGGEGWRGGGSG